MLTLVIGYIVVGNYTVIKQKDHEKAVSSHRFQ